MRVCLLLDLLSMMGATWLLENPGRSTITLHPWLQWLVKTIRKAGGRESFLELSNIFNQLLPLVAKLESHFLDQELPVKQNILSI